MKNIRHFFIVFCALFAVSYALNAKPVDVNRAEDIARSFLSRQVSPDGARLAPPRSQALDVVYSSDMLYVFQNSTKGFVIVSADDCVSPVIGYSDSGSFDIDNLPDNFRYWFNASESYMRSVVSGVSIDERPVSKAPSSSTYAAEVRPLLGDIAFSQSYPYNHFCPVVGGDTVVVGCVAVSMAQVMTYYRWPDSSVGQVDYFTTTDSIHVIADLNASYDWDNTLHSYSQGGFNNDQRDAIAKLLFHCGASAFMDYTVEGSGTQTANVPNALVRHFKYDDGVKLCNRENYNFSEWKDIIKNELNQKRPVIYSGADTIAGHAFNCDGYNSDDMFHINWGWGGYANGYYDLRYLNYETGSDYGYSMCQIILIGLRPDRMAGGAKPDSVLDHGLSLICDFSYDKDAEEFWFSVFNGGPATFNGKIGLAAYRTDGSLIDVYGAFDTEIEIFYSFSRLGINVSKFSSIAGDEFILRPVFKDTKSDVWKPIPGPKSFVSSLLVDLREGGAIVPYTVDMPKLVVRDVSVSGNSTESGNLMFDVELFNGGTSDFCGNVRAEVSPSDSCVSHYFGIHVMSGETAHYKFVIGNHRLTEGNYTVSFRFDQNNITSRFICDAEGGSEFPFAVNNSIPEPEYIVNVTDVELTDSLKIDKSDFFVGDTIVVNVAGSNKGPEGKASFVIGFFDSSSQCAGMSAINDVQLVSGSFSLTISHTLVELDVDSYNVVLFMYDYASNQWCQLAPYEKNLVSISLLSAPDRYYSLTLSSSAADRGAVVGGGVFGEYENVEFAAVPACGYIFDSWSDGSTDNPRSIMMTDNFSLEASFVPHTMSVSVVPDDVNFEFVSWSDGNTDNPRIFNVSDDLSCVAIFRMKENVALDNASISSADVYTLGSVLYVVGAEEDYYLFDSLGRLVYCGRQSQCDLPAGTYLVRLAGEYQKVVVK